MERDARFLSQFTEQQLQQVQDFMTLYNAYLEEQIQILGGKNVH